MFWQTDNAAKWLRIHATQSFSLLCAMLFALCVNHSAIYLCLPGEHSNGDEQREWYP